MKFLTNVIVTLKDGVLDPQGQTIGRALNDLGFDSVVRIRTGKIFRLEIESESEDKAKTIASDARRFRINGRVVEKPSERYPHDHSKSDLSPNPLPQC